MLFQADCLEPTFLMVHGSVHSDLCLPSTSAHTLSIYGIIKHIDFESYAVSIDHPLLHKA